MEVNHAPMSYVRDDAGCEAAYCHAHSGQPRSALFEGPNTLVEISPDQHVHLTLDAAQCLCDLVEVLHQGHPTVMSAGGLPATIWFFSVLAYSIVALTQGMMRELIRL